MNIAAKYYCLIIVVISICSVQAIDLLLPASAVQNAAAGCILPVSSPAGSHYNPAFLHPGVEAGLSYQYNLSDLALFSFHTSYRVKTIGFYLGTTHLSNPYYKETVISFANNFHREKFSYGYALRLINANAPAYYNDNRIAADLGMLWRTSIFTNAFSVKNITKTQIGKDSLPVVANFETNSRLSENGSISIGFEKETGYDFLYKVATSYWLCDCLNLIASYQYNPSRIGGGFLLSVRDINITYGALTHRFLPVTHYFSVGYDLFGFAE